MTRVFTPVRWKSAMGEVAWEGPAKSVPATFELVLPILSNTMLITLPIAKNVFVKHIVNAQGL